MTVVNKKNRREYSTVEMTEFLSGMGLHVNPTLHVNGPNYPRAVLSVDFGEPLEPVRLDNAQLHDLVSNMRSLARDVLGRDASLNIENNRGVYWVSVA